MREVCEWCKQTPITRETSTVLTGVCDECATDDSGTWDSRSLQEGTANG